MHYVSLSDVTDYPETDRLQLVAAANLARSGGSDAPLAELYQRLIGPEQQLLDMLCAAKLPGVTLLQTGANGWPDAEAMIGVFVVNGQRLPCFMWDVGARILIDSRTGKKQPASAGYGVPVAWATFQVMPKPVIDVVTSSPPMIYKNNTVDGITYQSYGVPKVFYVINPAGADLMEFGGQINTFRDFQPVPGQHLEYGDEVRVMGTAHHPVVPSGRDFLIPMSPYDAWGQFTRTGKPAATQGFYDNGKILGPVKPPALPKALDVTPAAAKGPEVSVAGLQEELVSRLIASFRYLRDDEQPVRYQVMKPFTSIPYRRPGPKLDMRPGTFASPRTIQILGSFTHPVTGQVYLLPLLTDGVDPFAWYYGIVEFANGIRYIEKLPDDADIPPADRKPTLSEHITNVSALLEVTAIKGLLAVKKQLKKENVNG